jgi:hypothetical protein
MSAGGRLELLHPQQIVFAHQPIHTLGIHRPSLTPQLGGDAWPSVARPLQRDALDRIAQLHVASTGLAVRIEAVETGPTHPAQLQHALHCQSTVGVHFFPDLTVDCGFPFAACSIRCSSMRCKHPFKKSISRVCCPILRSNSAMRPSDQRRCPWPGNAFPGPCRNSLRVGDLSQPLTSTLPSRKPHNASTSEGWSD